MYYIIKIIRTVFNYKKTEWITKKIDTLYSAWIGFEFKLFGEKSFVARNCTLRGGQYISIGKSTSIGRYGVITCWDSYRGKRYTPSICVGNNVSIGEYSHITAINSIVIGDNVLTGRRVTITDNSHGDNTWKDLNIPPIERDLFSKGPVIIEDNVWIGDKVSIMPGVVIGKGSVIAANSVVTRNVQPYSIVGGMPAKKLREVREI